MAERQDSSKPVSTKASRARQWAMSSAYQRHIEEARQAAVLDAARAAQATAAQQEALDALNAAGFIVRGIDCTAKTGLALAAWVRQHADGTR